MSGHALVTGGSGYIGGFIIQQLARENWQVNTTIRSLAKEAHVRAALNVPADQLHFFAADLTNDAGWAEAVAGCSHVVHVASPLPSGAVKHEDDLIVPAREGALRAVRFAAAAGVKRVVLTSSVAAIAYGHPTSVERFTEDMWTNLNGPAINAYAKSKTIAERAARDWVAANGGAMEFCSVNPSVVLGPVRSDDFSPSIEAVKKLLEGSLPGLPNLSLGIVDVRDVADLHVRALTAPNMAGERFIASVPSMSMVQIAQTLRDHLGAEARKVPTRRLPDLVLRIAAIFDPIVRQVTGELGKTREMDATHAMTVLGWETRPPAQSVIDTARSLIDLGIVKV